MYAKDVKRYKPEELVTYYEQDITSSILVQQAFFVVAYGAIENKKLLNNVLLGVENGGFLLTVENQFDQKFRENGIDVIAKYTDGQNTYILLKKVMITLQCYYFVIFLKIFLTHKCDVLI